MLGAWEAFGACVLSTGLYQQYCTVVAVTFQTVPHAFLRYSDPGPCLPDYAEAPFPPASMRVCPNFAHALNHVRSHLWLPPACSAVLCQSQIAVMLRSSHGAH